MKMRYIVFRYTDDDLLASRVNYWLEHGGELVGGLCVVDTRSSMYYCQAMLIPISAE